MPDTLTDLLPSERRHALAREYRMRLGVVAIEFGVALLAAAAILLIPTYIYLTSSIAAKEARLAGITAVITSSDESSLSVRLAALSRETAALSALASAPSASLTLTNTLALPRPGILLSGMTYTPAKGQGTLTLTGVAATRDALRNYQLALQSAPFATSAKLPVSAYAQDTNIAFSIVITLAP